MPNEVQLAVLNALNVQFEPDQRMVQNILRKAIGEFFDDEVLDEDDLATKGTALSRLEKTVTSDYGDFLQATLSGQLQNKRLHPRVRQRAAEIHREYGSITNATARVHRWAQKKYGTFYKYMQVRRMNKAMSAERASAEAEIKKIRTRAARTKRRGVLEARLKRTEAEKRARLDKPTGFERPEPNYARLGTEPGGKRAPIAAGKMKKARAEKAQQSRADQSGLGRTKFFNSGRMAAGLQEAAEVSIQRVNTEESVTVKIGGSVKNYRAWKDKEAGLAWHYMTKREDMTRPLTEGLGNIVVDMVMFRLQSRDAARYRPSQVKTRTDRKQGREARQEQKDSQATAAYEAKQKAKDEKLALWQAKQELLASKPKRKRGRPRSTAAKQKLTAEVLRRTSTEKHHKNADSAADATSFTGAPKSLNTMKANSAQPKPKKEAKKEPKKEKPQSEAKVLTAQEMIEADQKKRQAAAERARKRRVAAEEKLAAERQAAYKLEQDMHRMDPPEPPEDEAPEAAGKAPPKPVTPRARRKKS